MNSFDTESDALSQWCNAHLVEIDTVQPAARDGAASEGFDAEQFARAELLTVRFTDGSEYFTNPASFAARFASAAGTRSATPGRVILPVNLHAGFARSAGRPEDATGAVHSYRLQRLERPSSLDRVYEVGAQVTAIVDRWLGEKPPGAATLAVKLCALHESSVLRRGTQESGGLLAWSSAAGGWVFRARGPGPESTKRRLLFLHGTASSTAGSFGALWRNSSPEDRTPPPDFRRMLDRYGEVLAFEHRTLTNSPIDNAIDLLQQLQALPDGTCLDLVSHSRGGLVGELLALLTLADDAARDAARTAFEAEFGREDKSPWERGVPHPDAANVPRLFALIENLRVRRVCVGIFVRVACPARGTLLADRRTDLFLSLLVRSIGLALAANGNAFFESVSGLARGLVAARADARALPGLEAMIPGSALTRALNLHGLRVHDRLRVIAGDSHGKGWGGVISLLGDVFYGLHDHDFVVHTRSMFGGLERPTSQLSGGDAPESPMSLRVRGPAVTHFSYFGEPESRAALFAALAGGGQGFVRMSEDEARTRGLMEAFAGDPLSRLDRKTWTSRMNDGPLRNKPILVVLPGIMGSELAAASGERVWVAPSVLFGKAVRSLELTGDPAAAQALTADALIPVAYERLLRRASERFQVVTLPFDWRQPIQAAAATLTTLVRDLLEARFEACKDRALPVHFIAHSMGGLVARWAFFHDDRGRTLWNNELRDRGCRLLMLGTPNRGSYAPVRAMLQQHALCNLLGRFSWEASRADVARWCAGYPGLLQMLPVDDDPAYGALTKGAAWDAIRRADALANTPEALTLGQARSTVLQLHEHWREVCDDTRVLYVAGQGSTDIALERPAADAATQTPLRFRQSTQGDGTVPWTSVPSAARAWYVPAEHGSLADVPAAFDAYFELVERGATDKLSQSQPQSRAMPESGDGSALAPAAPPLELPSMPSDEEASAWLLGLGPRGRGAGGFALDKIDVSVVFGSLDYARFPLIVGHYLNDHIVSAEKRVDEKLDGQLTQLQSLNLYPGARSTSAYVRPNDRESSSPAYPGAIIVGLGNVGELTFSSLAETVARAILRYAFEHRNRDPFVPDDLPEDIRLSTLLVGSHSQAVTLRESLMGVLDGVWRAAKVLDRTRRIGEQVRIREIEIIEMWEYRALEAAYAMRQLLTRPEWASRFHWPRELLEGRDGGLTGIAIQPDRDWWQRLIIKRNDLGGMSYALIAEKARVEATNIQSDIESMSGLMDAVSDQKTASGFDSPHMSRALYEMLLPIELKSRLANFDNTVLIVDDKTAEYPWELLAPPRPEGDESCDEPPKPLVIQAGLMRQRLTDDFRRLPQISSEYNVLVVGAPDTQGWRDASGQPIAFRALPAAEDEAHDVTRLLDADPRDWQVNPVVGKTFDTVRLELLARPYRILHLCGHGVHDQWLRDTEVASVRIPVQKTGMVLSHQQVLGAGDVEQMSSVPELVFINCCYSAREGDAGAGWGARYPALAASMALKFIQMGAKAVVAAGWRVMDDAARLFARRFYQEMLAGQRFGDSVFAARVAVYDQYQESTNTWGAYQCYGDPDWSLDTLRRTRARRPGTSHLVGAEDAMSERELAKRIERVVAVAGDKPPAALLQQLNDLVTRVRADPRRESWLRTSTGVRTALGEAYRELGDHASAVSWFQAAASNAHSRLQLRQVELLTHSLARLDATATATEQARTRSLIAWLERAPPVLRGGLAGTASAELRALWASACLHRAIELERGFAEKGRKDVEHRRAQVEQLKDAAKSFGLAWAMKTVLDDFSDRRCYALSNFLMTAALAVLCSADSRKAQPARANAFLRQCHAAMRQACEPLANAHELPTGRRADVALDPASGERLRRVQALPQATDTGHYWVREADKRIQEMRESVPSTFWDYSNRVDLAVARCLFSDMTQAQGAVESVDIVRETERLLEGALVRWPSPRELESMKARFGLLAQVMQRREAFVDSGKAVVLREFAVRALRRLERHRPGVD